jgi:transposase
MRQPEEIEDSEAEQVVARVAAIDVAKATGMVCTRVPQETRPGRRVTKVWKAAATTNSLIEVADHLVCQGIERVVVESTGDYWRPFFYVLEARGLKVWLVNAGEVKNVPGRPKTDRLDAVWLAKLNERGMLRPSFVPPVEIRRLRDYTRLRLDLAQDRARYYQRLEKLLEGALIKVSAVASRMTTLSVRDMLDALIAGERDPRVLAGLARGRMRTKNAALVQALTGFFDDHHAEIAQMLLDQIDVLTAKIERISQRIEEHIAAIPASQAPDQHHTSTAAVPAVGPLPALDRLEEVPGIGRRGAQIILAEIGLDMSRFPTSGHLVSWAKLCPTTFQSGATKKNGKTGKGDPYLRGVLGEIATAAAKTQTFLGERYRRLVKRMGKVKAMVAVARSVLIIIWHLLNDPTSRFHDLGTDYYTRRVDTQRKTRDHVRQLQALGFTVTLQPTT